MHIIPSSVFIYTHESLTDIGTNVAVESLASFLRVLQFPYSNLGPESGQPDWVFLWFFLSRSRQIPDKTLKLCESMWYILLPLSLKGQTKVHNFFCNNHYVDGNNNIIITLTSLFYSWKSKRLTLYWRW